ncbi:unnamed protein product [Knipowitschia caucasica]|uniref:Uncharacterized protein n=1 Tax=Knipowitschia caucasica TaxID=637954 RepID=A0AAV2LP63_KNICA
MTAALTKLAFLVILAFIMCLPEFFTLNRVLHVSVVCARSLLCGGEDSTCTGHEEHKRADRRNMTQAECYVCKADVNISTLHTNCSTLGETFSFEVSITIQQNIITSENLSLLGHYNHSSYYLVLFDELEINNMSRDSLVYYSPSEDTDTYSYCLFWISILSGGLPWKPSKEWRHVLWGAWVSLLCVVLLLIIITVTREIICKQKNQTFYFSDKVQIHPCNYADRIQKIAGKKHQDVINIKAFSVKTRFTHSWSALSAIEEVDTPDSTRVQ